MSLPMELAFLLCGQLCCSRKTRAEQMPSPSPPPLPSHKQEPHPVACFKSQKVPCESVPSLET